MKELSAQYSMNNQSLRMYEMRDLWPEYLLRSTERMTVRRETRLRQLLPAYRERTECHKTALLCLVNG